MFLKTSAQTKDQEQNKEKIFIVSNRSPISDFRRGAESISVGGLTSALHHVAMERNAVWLFAGSKDDRDLLESFSPPGINYKLQPVVVDEDEYQAYYSGFSNSTIWPLFHYKLSRSKFDENSWEHYQIVNRKFAYHIANIAKDDPNAIIWIHDYHLFLVAKYLRDAGIKNPIGFFLHIPFPVSQMYRNLPERSEVLDAMLHFDLIGMHTQTYLNNFSDSVLDLIPGAKLEGENICYKERQTKLLKLPISVDSHLIDKVAKENETKNKAKELQSRLGLDFIALSADRVDYTKGIPEKIRGLDKFFTLYPEFKEKLSLIQIAVPCRTNITEYQNIKEDIEKAVGDINGRHGTEKWQPIIYMNKSVDFKDLIYFYHAADLTLITPIRDGFNLVAKEFLMARRQDTNVILSEFAGAAEDFPGAYVVNPHNSREIAEAIYSSVTQPSKNNDLLDKAKADTIINDVHKWSKDFINELARNNNTTTATKPSALSV